MSFDTLAIWNLLTTAELAAMFAGGMLPSEIPAGFEKRQQRLMAAYDYILEVAKQKPAAEVIEPMPVAISVCPPRKSNARAIVCDSPALRFPSVSAAAKAMKIHRDTLSKMLFENDKGGRLLIRGHVLRHADAA